jgi:hypothetical protein
MAKVESGLAAWESRREAAMSKPFPIDGNAHDAGAGEDACASCWSGFPRACLRDGCTGLVHQQYFDESWDSVQFIYRCTVCGDDEEHEE